MFVVKSVAGGRARCLIFTVDGARKGARGFLLFANLVQIREKITQTYFGGNTL